MPFDNDPALARRHRALASSRLQGNTWTRNGVHYLAARAIAWTHRAQERVCDRIEPWDYGTVYRSSRYPQIVTYLHEVGGELPRSHWHNLELWKRSSLIRIACRVSSDSRL